MLDAAIEVGCCHQRWLLPSSLVAAIIVGCCHQCWLLPSISTFIINIKACNAFERVPSIPETTITISFCFPYKKFLIWMAASDMDGNFWYGWQSLTWMTLVFHTYLKGQLVKVHLIVWFATEKLLRVFWILTWLLGHFAAFPPWAWNR